MQKIIQIIPYRRKVPDGVGDYGSQIATAWRQYDGTQTVFLAATPKDFDGECPDGHETHYLEEKTAVGFLKALQSLITPDTQIMLHMSAYGYEKRAIPFWLLSGLKQFKKLHPDNLIVSVFHEISAFSDKPWQSSFWVSPIQKHIAKKVAKLSDGVLTPCEKYLTKLKDFGLGSHMSAIALPVFSTIGELEGSLQKPSPATSKLAIFGNRQSRINIYNQYSAALTQACASLNISKIVDIGAYDSRIPKSLGDISVRSTGMLPAEAVSAELSQAQFGVLAYDATRLGKSTIFASYAAHGLGTICFDSSEIASDGLMNERHLIVTQAPLSAEQIQILRKSGLELAKWYSGHKLTAQIPIIASLFT